MPEPIMPGISDYQQSFLSGISNPTYRAEYANPFQRFMPGGNPTKKKGLGQRLGAQSDLLHALSGQTYGQRQGEYGTLAPEYQGLVGSQGYSPEEQAAIRRGAVEPILGAYRGAGAEASRRGAITQNPAGYGSFLGEIARAQGRDVSGAEAGLAQTFADEKLRRKMMGLQGLAQLYGIDTSFLGELGSQQLEALGIGSGVAARRRGVLGTIGAIADIGKTIGGLKKPFG